MEGPPAGGLSFQNPSRLRAGSHRIGVVVPAQRGTSEQRGAANDVDDLVVAVVQGSRETCNQLGLDVYISGSEAIPPQA